VAASGRTWYFITSHAVVLLQVAHRPDAKVSELAERSGLTERQTHRVLADLVENGYVVRSRVGRRNAYRVDDRQPLRHPVAAGRVVGDLLDALMPRRLS
jgi:DNA-binding transcriptional ArsR family regulator